MSMCYNLSMKNNKIKSLMLIVSTLLVGCYQNNIDGPISNEPESRTENNTANTTYSTDSIHSETETKESEPISSDKKSDVISDTEKDSEGNEYNWTIPSYYKSSIDLTLRNADLKTNLFQIIKDHTAIGYGNLYSAYLKTDLREDGTIWDMYSDVKYSPSENQGNYKKEGDMYNREHTIPQSIFNKKSPMVCDIFHVYPTDGYVNNRRSNYPHAEVSNVDFESSNHTKVGTPANSSISGKVCEPADEYKGDFARTYFYFVTCYQDKMSSFGSYASFSQNTYPSLSKWAISLYKKWSLEDPVSEKEINRNEAAYTVQGNRNPFIDFPGIENLIW